MKPRAPSSVREKAMLFDDEKKPSDLFAKLRQKIQEVSEVVRSLREENAALKKELEACNQESAKIKSKIAFYEGERQQLEGVVEELLRDFEKVAQ